MDLKLWFTQPATKVLGLGFDMAALCASFLARAGIVAGGAGCRRGFVKEHQAAVDRLLVHMAGCAGHILMPSLQRECSLLVVEKGGTPLHAVMAGCAVFASRAKLRGVRIFMAFVAPAGRLGESDMDH